MNPIYWTWAAVAADLGLFLGPWVGSKSLLTFWGVLLAHSLISVVAALATFLLLPKRFHHPRTVVTLLMFSFAFVAPVIGAVGLLILTRLNLSKSVDESKHAVPVSLDLLGDAMDDVRLVAFGMLDAEEKKISKEIRYETQRIEQPLSVEQRYDSLRRLAELNWEMVYACLAQGELRLHILLQAKAYVEKALALGLQPGSGLVFLQGRILLALNDFAGAEAAILRAVALGHAKTSAIPYLAEIAYCQRDFQQVSGFMRELATLNMASRTRAVEDFWNKRDREINYLDRRYLHHI